MDEMSIRLDDRTDFKESLKKPGDFTMAEGHGHPLVIVMHLLTLCYFFLGFGPKGKTLSLSYSGGCYFKPLHFLCGTINIIVL